MPNSSSEKIWPSADKIWSAREALAAADPALAVAHAAVPPFPWRAQMSGMRGLASMIISQQVSTASARAIWGRFEAGLGQVTPETVLAADDALLRSFGLSGQKVRYVRAIAQAQADGVPDLNSLPEDEDAAIAALTQIKGVGLWTAEVYLLFAEQRFDAFPAGDLALQEGWRMAAGAAERPNEKALYAIARPWRPNRGVAAHLLWAYYSMVKRGELALPLEGG